MNYLLHFCFTDLSPHSLYPVVRDFRFFKIQLMQLHIAVTKKKVSKSFDCSLLCICPENVASTVNSIFQCWISYFNHSEIILHVLMHTHTSRTRSILCMISVQRPSSFQLFPYTVLFCLRSI